MHCRFKPARACLEYAAVQPPEAGLAKLRQSLATPGPIRHSVGTEEVPAKSNKAVKYHAVV